MGIGLTPFARLQRPDRPHAQPSPAPRSGLTQIRSQANGRSIQCVEARFGLIRESSRGLPKSILIGPEAVAGELLVRQAGDTWGTARTEWWLGAAAWQMALSARAYHRVLKLARTIAELAGEERISSAQVAEALQYRPRVAEE